jgi:uncharacterized protein (TIGR03382 family)
LVFDGTGVLSNSIAGLSLSSFAAVDVVFQRDVEITAVFDISAALLTAMLVDSTIASSIQNGIGVDAFNTAIDGGQELVTLTVAYSSAVPAPASIALAGFGLLALFVRRRAKA